MGKLKLVKTRVMGLPQKREETIAILNTCFAKNLLDLEEFEQRLEKAEMAKSIDDLEEILEDVPEDLLNVKEEKKQTKTALSNTENIQCILGSKSISSSKLSALNLNIKAVMSSVVLNYSNLELPKGVIEVEMNSIMSSCYIIAGPGVYVENQMQDIMSSVHEDKSMRNAPQKPVTIIRLKGKSILSSIYIKMKGASLLDFLGKIIHW